MWFFAVVGGTLILGIAIAYGFIQYHRRDKSKDALTEAATRAVYHQEGERDEAEAAAATRPSPAPPTPTPR